MKPPLPIQESQRIASLRDIGILDTAAETDYDELVQLASHMCGTPISLVSLVDSRRQWFKARVGLEATETPRDISFCAHAICEPDSLLVVPDAREDARFAQNPLVVGEPGIRFYAGAPLVTADGQALGSLCVIDRRPRELSPAQRTALRTLARQVAHLLDLRRMVNRQAATIAELQRVRKELEQSREEALEAARAKSRFLAIMSHELRTPMNAVVGLSTLLDATVLNDEQRDYVETIRTSGELLLVLINDILDFSKIEAGQLELESIPFALMSCVDSSLSLVAGRAREKHLTLRRQIADDVPAAVVGDPVRLGQVLINLLSNAVKFTAQGEVSVELSATPAGNAHTTLRFIVRDTGIGIPAEKIPQLFEMYRQADPSTRRRFGGTGLGLSISKQLVEIMGGTIEVTSEVGAGSAFCFSLTLPVATDTGVTPQRGELDATFSSRHPARILVVDDNPINGRVACRLLERLGYSPDHADSGQAALDRIHDHPYDLVLMDIEMPELDGTATAAAMRQILPSDQRPVIAAVTAHALAGDRERFLQAGLDDYLAKPIHVDALRGLLSRLSETRRRRFGAP